MNVRQILFCNDILGDISKLYFKINLKTLKKRVEAGMANIDASI